MIDPARRCERRSRLSGPEYLALLFAILIGTLPAAFGQGWEVFNMNNAGLPSNTVRALAHGSNGVTWVGTDWGLCKFDGSSWEVFQVSNSNIPENDIRAVGVDDQGRVWVGFFTAGLSVLDGTTWQHYTESNSPLPGQTVRNITFDGNGFAWLSTSSGAVRTDLNDWRVYDNSETSYNNQILPGNNISDVAVRNDGLVCIGTLNLGFVYLTDTSVTVYSTWLNNLPDNTVLGVALDTSGQRWVACPFGGLLNNFGDHVGGFWAQYNTAGSNIPSNALNDVVIDAMNRKIIATQQAGVAIFSPDESWLVYNTANSDLPGNEVNQVSLAPDGYLWAATAAGGVARLENVTAVRHFPTERRGLELYPQPTTSVLYIRSAATGTLKWTVTRMDGGIVERGVFTSADDRVISVGSLSAGIFVLILEGAEYMQNAVFIVQ